MTPETVEQLEARIDRLYAAGFAASIRAHHLQERAARYRAAARNLETQLDRKERDRQNAAEAVAELRTAMKEAAR